MADQTRIASLWRILRKILENLSIHSMHVRMKEDYRKWLEQIHDNR